MNLSDHRFFRLFTLCSLYVAQGLPFGFVTIALKNYLHGRGVSVAETGAMIAMIAWPWALKFLWGPVIDRFGIPAMGRRRPWLLLAQGSAALVLLGLALTPGLEDNLRALGWAILSVNVFLALQDVSTDALAVDLLSERERGKVNGFMYGSSYLGSFLGGAVVGHFLTREGGSIQVAFGVLAAFLLAIMLLPLLLRERDGEKRFPWSPGTSQLTEGEAAVGSLGEMFRILRQAFASRLAIAAALYAVVALLANSTLAVVGANFFVTEVGWSAEAFSRLESLGLWFSLGGSVLGGFIADRLGPKRALLIAGSLLALLWIAFSQAAPLWDDRWFVSVFLCGGAALVGLSAVSGFSLFMGIANRRVAATQFTAYMAMLNLSIGTGSRISGWVERTFADIPSAYLACGIFHLGVMAFVLLGIHPKERRDPEELVPGDLGQTPR